MAASGASQIVLYTSTTAAAAPTPSLTPNTPNTIITGELALNVVDGKLYYTPDGSTLQYFSKDGAGTAADIAGGAANQLLFQTAAGSTSFVTAPTNNTYLTYTTGGGFAWSTIAAGGSVTSVSVVSANGFAGTVATPSTTPAITLSTTVNGILVGNGTGVSAASVTGTGDVVLSTSPTLVTPALGTPSALVGTNITGTAASLTAGLATAVAGGAANQLLFQSAPGVTAFATAPTVSGTVLEWNGTGFAWATPSGTTSNALSFATAFTTTPAATSFNGSAAVSLDLTTQSLTPATYGTAISIPVITVNSKGVITGITSVSTQGATYLGTWDAATNNPTLADGVGAASDYYIVTTAGTQNLGSGNLTFAIGDWVVYNGAIWQQVSNSQTAAFTNIALTSIPTGEFLVGNGTGLLTSTATIDLTSKVSGTLPINNGGTNSTATPTAGGVSYGTGTAFAFTGAGTSGQVLTSGGAGAPTWTTPTTGTVTSVATAGTVSGITLTGGPITSTGTITLGGSLDLSSPPAIGGTTPNSGAFTTLTASGNVTLSPTGANNVVIDPNTTGSIDNMIIGATSAKAITGTVITATSYFVGINGGTF